MNRNNEVVVWSPEQWKAWLRRIKARSLLEGKEISSLSGVINQVMKTEAFKQVENEMFSSVKKNVKERVRKRRDIW